MTDRGDPVTAYAHDVISGRIVAGYLVRLACARHLRDLELAFTTGLVWRVDKAWRVIDYFAEVLVLPDVEGPDGLPVAFILQPHEQFIAGSLFGWYNAAGHRRFRLAYYESGKGNNKTPFGAGLMLYMLTSDDQVAAQIYVAATSKDQAKLGFTDAENMVAASPELRRRVRSTLNNLSIRQTKCFFRPISSEGKGLDGKRVHGCMIDELHVAPTAVVARKMRKGTKNNLDALILELTNSGADRVSVCWNHHVMSRKVLERTVVDETWFAYVCGMDPCDACRATGRWFPDNDCPNCDDWRIEGPHWRKANPMLGVSLSWAYLRDLVNQAKGMPSEVSDLLRFNFCAWVAGEHRALDMSRWALCGPMPSDEELVGARCYGGLDIGETDDFTAWVVIWLLEDGRIAVKCRFWIPKLALELYPDRPYKDWLLSGALTVTEGQVTDYALVREQIAADCADLGIDSVAYDPRSARETSQLLTAAGIVMVSTSQGYALHEAIKRFLETVIDGTLCHGNDPILTWMASNLVLRTGEKKEKRLDKDRSPEKIDGIAALVTVFDHAVIRRETDPPADDPEVIWAG